MRITKSCGLIAATLAIHLHCTKFDGHVDDLPPETERLLKIEESHSAKELIAESRDDQMVAIGKIFIFNRTVLPDSDFFAPLINNLHYVTQADVIRDELNVYEGQTVPAWRIYDAERYVRGLAPIKQATIVQVKNKESGKTDLHVVTSDKITAQINGAATGQGGYSSFGFQVTESSLFGRLYSLTGSYSRENFRDHIGISAGKQRINGSRWQVSTSSGISFSDSKYNSFSQGITIAHPFLRDGQNHAFNFSARYANGVGYDYYGGGIRKGINSIDGSEFDLIYRTRVEHISAQYLFGYGKNDRIEFGPGVTHYVRRDYYIKPADQYTFGESPELAVGEGAKNYYRPQQFSARTISFALNTRNGRFAPMKNFHRYLFVEDQFEGFRTGTNIVHADPAFGLKDHYTAPTFGASFQKNFFEQKFRLETGFNRSAIFWHDGRGYANDDLISGGWTGFYFHRYGTLAIRQSLTKGYNLTADSRNSIAGMFGRGFYYGSIFPDAGFLSSLEYRSPGLKLPYVLLAGVAFFDYAGVGTTLSTLGWNPIIGFGLRSMLYEFDNNVFRFDLGFNLNDSKVNLLNALQFGLNHSF
ncbi:MAG: hypothetical protein U1F16_18080 [Turneriella sp.]